MQTKRIGDIFQLSGQERAGTVSFPVMSITMHQGLIDQSEKFKKRIASINTSKYKVVYKNELVVGFPIDEGVIGFQTKYKQAIVSPAYDIWRIKDGISCNIDFIGRYLRSNTARRIYASKMRGAVARRRSITKDDFVSIKVPFPPLEDQIRIAAVLTRVETLIFKRKESLKMLDELLKSTFVEIFGDSVNNDKGWERVTIRDLITEAKYGTSKPAEGGEYRYLRMNNITNNGYWDFSDLKYIDINDQEKEKYNLRKNDLVFNRTNSKELVGKTAVYSIDEEAIIAGYLIRVRTKEDVNPWYIWGYLNSRVGKLRLFNLCRNIVGMANINAQELQDIPILKPPIELQNQFASIVEKVEVLKSKYTQSLINLGTLYDSLSQQAFMGEVDLSKVIIDFAIEQENTMADVFTHENTVLIKFSEKELKKIIKAMSGRAFSFDELMRVVESTNFEQQPQYDEIKGIVFALMKGNRPTLRQSFEETIDEKTGERIKKIVLRVNI